jgi:hypothetical protein
VDIENGRCGVDACGGDATSGSSINENSSKTGYNLIILYSYKRNKPAAVSVTAFSPLLNEWH